MGRFAERSRPFPTREMHFQGRAGACSRRFRPLREGAVKCTAFDWGEKQADISSLPPSFAYGKSHPLTAAVSLYRFATSPSHCEGVDPLRGRGYGAPSRRPLRSNCIFIFQSERSRPFPTIFHYSFFIIHPFSGRRVTAAPLPLCRCATFPLTGESHRPLRTKWNAFAPTTPIFHSARKANAYISNLIVQTPQYPSLHSRRRGARFPARFSRAPKSEWTKSHTAVQARRFRPH